MMSQNGQGDATDAWTSMPLDLDAEIEPLAVASPIAIKLQIPGLDLHGFFWKYFAAGDTSSPGQILNCLAQDERIQIRKRVAENHSTPADALAFLADDASAAVRAAVARNPKAPIFVLRKLSQDIAKDVRFAIACNPAMPDAILLSLFLDPDPMVADRASQTLAA